MRAQVYEKEGSHRAMGDIKESVAELKFYKNLFFTRGLINLFYLKAECLMETDLPVLCFPLSLLLQFLLLHLFL
jgi:hypothetical protein